MLLAFINFSYLGYFEDEKHSAGHFQSIVPFRDSVILQLLRDQGGPDVAEILHFRTENSGQYISVLFLNFNYIKRLIRFFFFMYHTLSLHQDKSTIFSTCSAHSTCPDLCRE